MTGTCSNIRRDTSRVSQGRPCSRWRAFRRRPQLEPLRQRRLVLRADHHADAATDRREAPPIYTVSLTLSGNKTNPFILDTGSLGLVADPEHYYTMQAAGDKHLAHYATITYSTSGANPVGALYLTNVQINGANGQSVTARVPILACHQRPGYSASWASASTAAAS